MALTLIAKTLYNSRFYGSRIIGERHAARKELVNGDILLNITGFTCPDLPGCFLGTDRSRKSARRKFERSPRNWIQDSLLLAIVSTQAVFSHWQVQTRNALTKAMIESLSVSATSPLPEQRAIAHILGTLDDKIELNRRMNQTLEEMARAIFKDWFIDFGPTRAKMEGREPYLPAEVWDLFPVSLEDSELGPIPTTGWEVEGSLELLDAVIGGDWGRRAQTPPIQWPYLDYPWHGYTEPCTRRYWFRSAEIHN